MGIVDYQRTGDLVEINVRDGSGRKVETLICNARDKKKYKNILEYLRDKYGFEPYVDGTQDLNSTTPKEEQVDWWG